MKILVCGGRDYAREWSWETNGWVWNESEVRRFHRIMGVACEIASVGGSTQPSPHDNGPPLTHSDGSIIDGSRWNSSDHRDRVPSDITIIHGCANGADTLAGKYAEQKGLTLVAKPANWKKHGKAAGFIRNTEMLKEGPDLVIAFPGGKGTRMMIDIATKAGVDVWKIQ